MKTMLDKCAVAGDITQAIDRRGAWSCAVTVIGGTENTAVKLQSADSADGEFTDFKTLISADEAEADQYKGFVLDLSGAGNFIKIVGATMATCVLGDCDHDVKKVAIKAGEIPSGADLEDNKTATIDVSTYTEPVEIEPTEGKDGMKKATITLSNIPSGGGNQGYAIFLENGDSDATIFSKIVCFGGATPTLYSIPAGTYDAFFVTDDVYTGEDHDFTDIPSLFLTPSNVSATRVGNNPRYYRVVISAETNIKNIGEYGTQGREALLTLFPVNA